MTPTGPCLGVAIRSARRPVVVGHRLLEFESDEGAHTSIDRNARKLDLDYEAYFFWYGCYENVPNSKSYVSRKI